MSRSATTTSRTSTEGSELSLVFISSNGQFLNNEMPDDSALHTGMRFFKAIESIGLAQFAALRTSYAKCPGGQIAT